MALLKRASLPIALLLSLAAASHAMNIVPPIQYGRVILNNSSTRAGIAPAVFEHWLHRAMFTCRLCHVDIGFAMEGGASRLSAATNRDGFHCGACHNGRTVYEGRTIFAACSDNAAEAQSGRCARCHSPVDQAKQEKEFAAFFAKFPKTGFGNGVDWEMAEETGRIRPLDFVEGVSIRRPPLTMEKEIAIKSRGTWMTDDVIFSHKKHAAWNGCEVCHPEIFPSTKQGTVRYSMFQIVNGEYCGVCHAKVAFPLIECQKCHIKPVR